MGGRPENQFHPPLWLLSFRSALSILYVSGCSLVPREKPKGPERANDAGVCKRTMRSWPCRDDSACKANRRAGQNSPHP
jgi:hypothetical protein